MIPILVVGDYIDDTYKWCRCPRMCPEAPAPVLIVDKMETRPGGAGNVYENLVSISARSNADEVAELESLSLSTKIRYFVGNRLMFREDQDAGSDPESIPDKGNLKDLELCFSSTTYRGVIISDYGKGGVTDQVVKLVLSESLHKQIPVFVDAKCHDPNGKYAGAFCIFPNEDEHPNLDPKKFGHIIRKLGPKGCSVDGKHVKTREQPVFDVTGAGDVFLAAFVLKYLEYRETGVDEQGSLLDAAYFANIVAGISVRHVGTYAVHRKEIDREILVDRT